MATLSAYLAISFEAISFALVFPMSNLIAERLYPSGNSLWAMVMNFSMVVGQLLSALFWGYFADRWGRRKIALTSTVACILMNLSFGLSTNYWWMVSSRFILGLACCLSTISYSLINEIERTSPRANAWVLVYWQVGYVLGNVIGGVFSEVSGKYPFVVPSLIASSFGVTTLVLSLFFMPETLTNNTEGKSYFAVLSCSKFRWNCLAMFAWNMVDIGFQEIVITWLWTGRYQGGLGLNWYEIISILSLSYLIMFMLEIPVYRILLKYLNILQITRFHFCVLQAY